MARVRARRAGYNNWWIGACKEALSNGPYSFVGNVSTSRTLNNHSRTMDLRVRGPSGEVLDAIAKQNIFNAKSLPSIEHRYREPARLHAATVRALQLSSVINTGLPPSLFGYSTRHSLHISEKFRGDSLHQRIWKRSKKDEDYSDELEQGVFIAAQLNGMCTGRLDDIHREHGTTFEDEASLRDSEALDLLESRITRLSRKEGFSARQLIGELRDLGSVNVLREIFGHGDFNLHHVMAESPDAEIGEYNRVIDFETSGIYSHVVDFVDILMVRKVPPLSIIQSEEFSRLVGSYLLWESMFENGATVSEVSECRTLSKECLARELKARVGPQYFADFVLTSFTRALEKQVHFATHDRRHLKQYQRAIGGLYAHLAGPQMIPFFNESSQEGKIRQYTGILGSLLRESGFVTIPTEQIESVSSSPNGGSYGLSQMLMGLGK